MKAPRTLDRPPAAERRISLLRRGATWDLLGLALVILSVTWLLISAGPRGVDAEPPVLLVIGSAAVYAAGRLIGLLHRMATPIALLASAIVIAIVSDAPLLSSAPLSGPFGYVNAEAAFIVQLVAALAIVAVGVRSAAPRWAVLILAAAGALVPVALRSWASAALAMAVLVVAVLPPSRRRPGRLVIASAAVLVGALSLTVLVGAVHTPTDPGTGVVDRVGLKMFGERRVALWHEALAIMADHPLTGVGPGRFRLVSPTARSDVDASWAHHGFLQQAAETGVAGLALMLLLFGWGFARLWAARRPDAGTAVAAAALAALGVHACIDYVMHFPAVPLAAAAVLAAGVRSRSDDRAVK